MRLIAITLLLCATRLAGAQPAGGMPAHQDLRWDERGGAALRAHVAPGKYFEWCGPLKAGETVDWEFESGNPLDVNVHWHEGSAVHYPVQKEAVQVWSGRLAVASDQNYCWMWTNRSSTPVALQARASRVPAR